MDNFFSFISNALYLGWSKSMERNKRQNIPSSYKTRPTKPRGLTTWLKGEIKGVVYPPGLRSNLRKSQIKGRLQISLHSKGVGTRGSKKKKTNANLASASSFVSLLPLESLFKIQHKLIKMTQNPG